MSNLTIFLGVLALTYVGVTLHAWWLGNERRDLALLASFSGLCGVGTAVSAAL